MFRKSTSLKSLPAAEAVLEQFTKLDQAIGLRVVGLHPLIRQRLEAERELRNAEAAVAIGEQADAQKVQKRAVAARADLDRAADVLRGLRARQAALGGELVGAREQLSGEMPEHRAAVAEDFRAEWQKAVASFSAVLSRRAAIERICGPLDLPEATAGTCELESEVLRPNLALSGLASAIKTLASAADAAKSESSITAPVLGTVAVLYDATRVYRLTRATRGLEKDMLVVDASFSEGRLRHLVECGWAVPVRDRDVDRGLRDAKEAAERITREVDFAEKRRLDADSEKRQAERRTEDERRDPSLRWRDGMERRDPNDVNTSPPRRVVSDSGPAAEVAAGREQIERMVLGN